MTSFSDPPVELEVASRILGISNEQTRSLCTLFGFKPVRHSNAVYLERRALDYLYRRLNPPFDLAA